MMTHSVHLAVSMGGHILVHDSNMSFQETGFLVDVVFSLSSDQYPITGHCDVWQEMRNGQGKKFNIAA